MPGKTCALAILCFEATIGAVTNCLAADQDTEAPYPTVHASTDSSVVARGRNLVLHVAVCGHCHSLTNGAPGPDGDVQLSGVRILRNGIPVDEASPGAPDAAPANAVAFSVPNITSDVRTGIGALSDATIARTLRSGLTHDGHRVPMMNYAFADDDLTAVVSYLRATRPVEHEVPRVELKLPPGVLPTDTAAPHAKPLSRSPRGISVARGRYLVESVADCGACHTATDMRTGQPSGSPLSGGVSYPDQKNPKLIYQSANLTRDGRLATWSENDFVARFRAGPLLDGSAMPWAAYQGMPENDLRSIYRYLKSLPAGHAAARPSVTD
jgi:mono/diheme cytochrome c family protein